jgi:hypothetical protein
MSDPHNVQAIPVGTPVVGYDGVSLGNVREVYPHYLLVGQDGVHGDLDIPVHAIRGFTDGVLEVSVTQESATPVDDEESAHRSKESER